MLQEIYFTKKEQLFIGVVEKTSKSKKFECVINSGDFAGKALFNIPLEQICLIVARLEKIKEFSIGDCLITSSDSNSVLRLYFENNKLFVEGVFTNIFDHMLKFVFSAERTILQSLSAILVI